MPAFQCPKDNMKFNTETMLTTAIFMPATLLDIAVPVSLRDAGETTFTGAMKPSIYLF